MSVNFRKKSGFSLIEVTIALGIAGFCLIAILGLLPLGVNSNRTSIEETGAMNAMSAVVADLRQTPNPIPKGSLSQNSLIFNIPIPASVPAASGTTTLGDPNFTTYISEDGGPQLSDNNSRYRLSVWTTPGVGKQATLVRMIISWPAPAPLKNATGSVEVVVALDRS